MSNKNRGMFWETIINKTIEIYTLEKKGFFQKQSVPLRFSINKTTKKITKAYIINNGFVDYIGLYQGYFLAFEAKSTINDVWWLKNLLPHQLAYLKQIDQFKGLAFLLLHFNHNKHGYLIWVNDLINLKQVKITIAVAKKIGIQIPIIYPGIIDFLKVIKAKIANF